MSDDDRQKWNSKYADPEFAPRNPSQVLLSLAEWLPPWRGRALDIAGGGGRHSIWLAQQGFDVTLADISTVGLQVAQQRAAEAGVTIHTLERDIAEQGLPEGDWDLILSVCYLWKPTPELMRDSLKALGVFIMIQPTTINLTRHEKPPRDFLLEPGELDVRFNDADCEGYCLQRCHYAEDWSLDDRHDAVLVVRREEDWGSDSDAFKQQGRDNSVGLD